MAFPIMLAMAAFQVGSSIQQASLIMDQARLQDKVNEENALSFEAAAFESEAFGYTQAARYQTDVDQVIANQQVGFASQGIDVTSGTAKALQDEARLTGELNMNDMIRAGSEQAHGLRFKASDARLGSMMNIIQAESTASAVRTSGIIQGASTGLSGYQDFSKNQKIEAMLKKRG